MDTIQKCACGAKCEPLILENFYTDYYVECPACGLRGPLSISKSGAQLLWDNCQFLIKRCFNEKNRI